MVGHADALLRRRLFRQQIVLGNELCDVPGEPADAGRLFGEVRSLEQMPKVLDGRPATRRVDDHRIEAALFDLLAPASDVASGPPSALLDLAQVVIERTAATAALGDDHFAAVPGQKPDGCIVDVGVDRLLDAARHQGHPVFPRTLGRKRLRVVIATHRRQFPRGHGHHVPQPSLGHERLEGSAEPREQHENPKPRRIRQDLAQHPADEPVSRGAAVIVFDVLAGMIDQMHVVDPRGAGRHAPEARQAAIDVLDSLAVGSSARLEHVLDHVDAAPRTVALVAKHLVGRAGRSAESAVNAGPQNRVRTPRQRVVKLRLGKLRLHGICAPISPGFRICFGSNLLLSMLDIRASGAGSG